MRICPRCEATDVHRSRRRGFFEHTVLRVIRKRPFRCFACGYRYYDHPEAVAVKATGDHGNPRTKKAESESAKPGAADPSIPPAIPPAAPGATSEKS
ncbi:MAG: hypothetical protein JO041_10590 [Acidobacteria bacterium]|nr:hypothetical protein [Acidobacteriota bacterium]